MEYKGDRNKKNLEYIKVTKKIREKAGKETLGDGVIGELSRNNEADGSLNFSGGNGRLFYRIQ